MSDITLTGGIRSNLLSLQNTTRLIEDTQFKLSTGKKVNSALDDPISFFKAQDLNYRAGDLSARKDGILQAQKTIEAADTAISSLLKLADQATAIAEQAAGTALDEKDKRASLMDDYDEIKSQMDLLIQDADYQGVNLLQTDDLTVEFGQKTSGSSQLDISGLQITALSHGNTSDGTFKLRDANDVTGIAASDNGGTAINHVAWDSTGVQTISFNLEQLENLKEDLRTAASGFGTSNAILETRREFTDNLVNTLESGAGELVNADMNQESANMLSLQTRQQLGTISLSIANQAEQSVLRLF